ncbi:MAG: DEAD/DEAH box helicase [Akkermansiaceae bacterium]|nr:DEAD/DEAH box helicase [Akkermansiaceae bacterium]
MSDFKSLGIPADLIQGLEELGIHKPTPVQKESIPYLMEKGFDFVAQAQTGTGKTAAFGLPLLTKIDPKKKQIQVLILAPTRELAKQIHKALFKFTKYAEERIFLEVVAGGDKIEVQISRLQRPTHVLVATPGRLYDLLQRKAVSLDAVQYLILDEADEMLSMGFKDQIKEAIDLTKARKATWLFSATFPNVIRDLVKFCMSPDPKTVKIDTKNVVNRNIDHRYAVCVKEDKTDFIDEFLHRQGDKRGLIFTRTRDGADILGKKLSHSGHSVGVLQGDLTQLERDKVMRAFKKERTQFLVATDVAARGIDVEGLSFVVHHQLPEQIDYYTHRSGRTARAGKKGTSLVLIDPREKKKLMQFSQTLGIHFGPA